MAKMPNAVAIFVLWASLCLAAFAAPGNGKYPGSEPPFFQGFDLSSLKIMEDGGAVYKNAQQGNVTMPVEDMLEGMNVVMLRLWVHPKVPYDGGYYETYNLKYVMALAKRFYSKGYHIYLDYRA